MTSRRNAENQRGFTLIEVTLAFTLLALMLLILYSSFALGSRAEEKVAVRVAANERIRAVEGLLAGYIRSAYPYRNAQGGAAAGIVFSGAEESLTFVSALSLLSGERGLANVTITFTTDDEGKGVLRLQESLPVRLGGGQLEESEAETSQAPVVETRPEEIGGITHDVVLAENLTLARISYLEVTEDTEEWVADWDGSQRQSLPKAVRIILEAGEAEPAEWVFPIMFRVLTVEPKVNA
jgi:general secretion pathway protein J